MRHRNSKEKDNFFKHSDQIPRYNAVRDGIQNLTENIIITVGVLVNDVFITSYFESYLFC